MPPRAYAPQLNCLRGHDAVPFLYKSLIPRKNAAQMNIAEERQKTRQDLICAFLLACPALGSKVAQGLKNAWEAHSHQYGFKLGTSSCKSSIRFFQTMVCQQGPEHGFPSWPLSKNGVYAPRLSEQLREQALHRSEVLGSLRGHHLKIQLVVFLCA